MNCFLNHHRHNKLKLFITVKLSHTQHWAHYANLYETSYVLPNYRLYGNFLYSHSRRTWIWKTINFSNYFILCSSLQGRLHWIHNYADCTSKVS